MSLTSKQIDELRAYAKDRKGELAKLINDAADTIEMLSAKLHASQMERSSQYYHGGWIPCSERLPKKNGFYLCTTKDCITILEFIEGNPHYHEEPSFVSDVLGKCNSYVIAWMPLPEPYKEGES